MRVAQLLFRCHRLNLSSSLARARLFVLVCAQQVNLIMDTMGALALGTEPPTLELLKRRPYSRRARLITNPMIRNILVMSVFQLALLLGLLFAPHVLFAGMILHVITSQALFALSCCYMGWKSSISLLATYA